MEKISLVLSKGINIGKVITIMNKHFDVFIEKEVIHLMKHEPSKSLIAEIVLTEKERKVILLLEQGHTYAEIAKRMKMTIDGVRYYIKKIYKKLGVNNSRKAVSLVASFTP